MLEVNKKNGCDIILWSVPVFQVMHIEDRRKLTFKKIISTRCQERLFVALPKRIVGLIHLFPLSHLMVIGPIYFGKPFILRKKIITSKQKKVDATKGSVLDISQGG